MWRIVVEQVLSGLIKPEHRGHQIVAVSTGEYVILPPTICKQCRDEWTQGVYKITPYDDKPPHMEPLCRRCATFVVPRREAFGKQTVRSVDLVFAVTRYSNNDWEIET